METILVLLSFKMEPPGVVQCAPGTIDFLMRSVTFSLLATGQNSSSSTSSVLRLCSDLQIKHWSRQLQKAVELSDEQNTRLLSIRIIARQGTFQICPTQAWYWRGHVPTQNYARDQEPKTVSILNYHSANKLLTCCKFSRKNVMNTAWKCWLKKCLWEHILVGTCHTERKSPQKCSTFFLTSWSRKSLLMAPSDRPEHSRE